MPNEDDLNSSISQQNTPPFRSFSLRSITAGVQFGPTTTAPPERARLRRTSTLSADRLSQPPGQRQPSKRNTLRPRVAVLFSCVTMSVKDFFSISAADLRTVAMVGRGELPGFE